MDLQLGLAVSCVMDKGFDLNSEDKGRIEEESAFVKKRNFDEAFVEEEGKVDVPRTLPLLVWDKQGGDGGGDDLDDEADSSSVMNNKSVRNDDHCVVGWPPLNPWRKKICQQNHRQGCAVNFVAVANGGGARAGPRGKNSVYVKVKMEGVGIARKVDLNLYHSHQTLLQTLVGMFGKCQESVQFYQLDYQDEEGNWQLVDNVNWGSFKRSVQRLKLVRKG